MEKATDRKTWQGEGQEARDRKARDRKQGQVAEDRKRVTSSADFEAAAAVPGAFSGRGRSRGKADICADNLYTAGKEIASQHMRAPCSPDVCRRWSRGEASLSC